MRIITRLLALNAAWSLVPPATTRRHLAAAPAATAAGAREIVLISGFESFNCALYEKCAQSVKDDVRVTVFSDRDLQSRKEEVAAALDRADAFVGSLLFDYDDVEWLVPRVDQVRGPHLCRNQMSLRFLPVHQRDASSTARRRGSLAA
jgi:hypothetical protein